MMVVRRPYDWQVVIQPAIEPVSLDEAKLQARVDNTADNAWFMAQLAAARMYVENRCSIALITQTIELTLDSWPTGSLLELPAPPLQSVASVTCIDSNGASTVMAASDYQVIANRTPGAIGLAYGAAWPTTTLRTWSGITVRYTAGYGVEPAQVPAPLRHAIRMLVAHWYTNREAVAAGSLGPVPFAVDSLLYPYEVR